MQPAKKHYGTSIMIGEATYQIAKDAVDTRLLDILVPKGTTKPTRVYEVIAKKGKAPPAKMDLAALYEQALRLHWERRWDDALLRLDDSLNIDFKDVASLMLRDRIIRYRENPPPEEWVGDLWRPS
jgi:hypothetical protein